MPEGLQTFLSSKSRRYIEMNRQTKVPIEIVYESPESLGLDRVASAAGGWTRFPGRNILVISAGTAITVDLVTSEGRFNGGNISPGVSMRLKALHEHTASLPLVGKDSQFSLLGSSTRQAILSGVMNGVIFELEGYVRLLTDQYKDLLVLLTGGDAALLSPSLHFPHQVEPQLLFEGLQKILAFNS